MKKFLLRRHIESSRHIEAEDWDAAHIQLIAFKHEPVVEPDAVIEGSIEYIGECDADDEGVLKQAVIDAAKEWVRANVAFMQESQSVNPGSPVGPSALAECERVRILLTEAVEQLGE